MQFIILLQELLENSMKNKESRKQTKLILVSFMLIPIVAIVCLSIGRYAVNLFVLTSVSKVVLLNIRLPRIILAAFCGAGLSCAGIAFQALFSNPLATPDTLGTASGASFGAVLALMLGLNFLGMQIFALIFGLLACFITCRLSSLRGNTNLVMLILSGIMVSAIFQALLSVLKYIADPNDQLPSITYWLLGSMSAINVKNLTLGLPFILTGIIILVILKWKLNILTLSDDEAKSLGMNLKAARFFIILASSMITASCVSMCGQIGWVGLLIPHISRMLAGNNNKYALPLSIGLGAPFMLIIDTVARTLSAAEIPVSIITALIGAPLFVILLRKTGKQGGFEW